MAESENLWVEMLGVLKDISMYLSKEDATQEKAKIDNPPKISEKQDEIVGGGDPAGKPGVGIAKSSMPDMGSVQHDTEEISAEGKSQLKKAKDEDEDDEESDEDSESSSSDVEELKSLLKDIRNALLTKSDVGDVSSLIAGEIKKQLPSTMDRMLRKMGYVVTKPDIVKLGVEDGVLKKSSDSEEKVESLENKIDEVNKIVGDLSKKSWTELGNMRAAAGDFNMFPR